MSVVVWTHPSKSGNRRRGERRLREKLTQKNEKGPDLAESEAVAWQPVVQRGYKNNKRFIRSIEWTIHRTFPTDFFYKKKLSPIN